MTLRTAASSHRIVTNIAIFALALKLARAIRLACRWPGLAHAVRKILLDFLAGLHAPGQDALRAHVRRAHQNVEARLTPAKICAILRPAPGCKTHPRYAVQEDKQGKSC